MLILLIRKHVFAHYALVSGCKIVLLNCILAKQHLCYQTKNSSIFSRNLICKAMPFGIVTLRNRTIMAHNIILFSFRVSALRAIDNN